MRGLHRSSTIKSIFMYPPVHLEIADQRHQDLLANAERRRLERAVPRRRRSAGTAHPTLRRTPRAHTRGLIRSARPGYSTHSARLEFAGPRRPLSGGGEEAACGWLKDKYGVSWQVIPTVLIDMISGPDPEKTTLAAEATLAMTKFDIAALEKAPTGDNFRVLARLQDISTLAHRYERNSLFSRASQTHHILGSRVPRPTDDQHRAQRDGGHAAARPGANLPSISGRTKLVASP
jgi:3-demethylubiquinone-9 3-methyltransferase